MMKNCIRCTALLLMLCEACLASTDAEDIMADINNCSNTDIEFLNERPGVDLAYRFCYSTSFDYQVDVLIDVDSIEELFSGPFVVQENFSSATLIVRVCDQSRVFEESFDLSIREMINIISRVSETEALNLPRVKSKFNIPLMILDGSFVIIEQHTEEGVIQVLRQRRASVPVDALLDFIIDVVDRKLCGLNNDHDGAFLKEIKSFSCFQSNKSSNDHRTESGRKINDRKQNVGMGSRKRMKN